MVLQPDEFKDYLTEIATILERDDYRRIINRDLTPQLDEIEREKIIAACERIASVLKRKEKEEFIEGYKERIIKREKLKRKYGETLLNRQDAIRYTGLPESTFDRKVRENDLIEDRNGKPGFRIANLNKIMKLTLDSSKLVLCINTKYLFDRKRDGFLPFYGGKYYKIVEENEKFLCLYNEKWNASITISRNVFEIHFRVEEDINFSQF